MQSSSDGVSDKRKMHPDNSDDEPRSPLWMVTRDYRLNELVASLSALAVSESRGEPLTLSFSRAKLDQVRSAFGEVIRQGERSLHQLCQLFASLYLQKYQIESVVIGQVQTNRERFTLLKFISPDELYSTIDLDLGNRQLSKLQFWDGTVWSKADLVANVVEYQPTMVQEHRIHRIISRIKAEEEIWNKVADEIFQLDKLIERDKELRHLSSFVKDIFGVKFVVASDQAAYSLQAALHRIQFSTESLSALGINDSEEFTELEFMEVKDYLSESSKKRSGWEAVKSVANWGGRLFEIQIQPLSNFLMERERLTRESHSEFKLTRENVRNAIAERYPMFGYCRDLLRWLFKDNGDAPPTHPDVKIILSE